VRILISNDDGIYSPGIHALAGVAEKFGAVRIVAPDVEQSSVGHAISSSRPLSYIRTRLNHFEAYRVDGTPADCVTLGAANWEKVDLVLSGINLGMNLGSAIWHSGTLAAAKQAALLGLRGIAISAPPREKEPGYIHLIPYVERVLEEFIANPTLQLVNVNIPERPQGILWTRQSIRRYDAHVSRGKDPTGRECFWFTVTPLEETEEGTDRWAVSRGEVSMTPLRLDPTDHETLRRLAQKSSSSEPDSA
jgi:5'-nucleotidase